MDLTVRMPQQFREKELELRNIVAHALQRGKADLIITVEYTGGNSGVEFNVKVMKSYKEQIGHLSDALGIPEPNDWFGLLTRFPDVLHTDNTEDPNEEDIEALLATTSSAIERLMDHRRSEGERLEEFFTRRIEHISVLLGKVPEYETERIEKIRARIQDSLSLINCEYDKGRFEQEMIYYIEKLDFNEEKQRLSQHLRYFLETMQNQNGGQGKKLGFIAQEMGREINTLGSKSNHAELQKVVVMMKDELEQIKEQVLNVM